MGFLAGVKKLGVTSLVGSVQMMDARETVLPSVAEFGGVASLMGFSSDDGRSGDRPSQGWRSSGGVLLLWGSVHFPLLA